MSQFEVDIQCPHKKCGALISAGKYRALSTAKKAAVELTNHLHIKAVVWDRHNGKVAARYLPADNWLTMEDADVPA